MSDYSLYNNFRPEGSPAQEDKDVLRFSAKDKLHDAYNHPNVTSELVEALIRRLNDSNKLTDCQWGEIERYLDSGIKDLNPNSEEGRKAIKHLQEVISTRR